MTHDARANVTLTEEQLIILMENAATPEEMEYITKMFKRLVRERAAKRDGARVPREETGDAS